MVDKKSALETALAQIKKHYGDGAVMKLGENSKMKVAKLETAQYI